MLAANYRQCARPAADPVLAGTRLQHKCAFALVTARFADIRVWIRFVTRDSTIVINKIV